MLSEVFVFKHTVDTTYSFYQEGMIGIPLTDECVCDVSRGYYHIDEGICGLVQIPCTPAGRQLSLHGNTYKEPRSIYAYYDWLVKMENYNNKKQSKNYT
jgi:hypothetical protein